MHCNISLDSWKEKHELATCGIWARGIHSNNSWSLQLETKIDCVRMAKLKTQLASCTQQTEAGRWRSYRASYWGQRLKVKHTTKCHFPSNYTQMDTTAHFLAITRKLTKKGSLRVSPIVLRDKKLFTNSTFLWFEREKKLCID